MYQMDKHTENMLNAALHSIESTMAILYWNTFQQEMLSPFRNTGAKMEFGLFKVHAYDWREEEGQPFNFKWRDLRIKWYKNVGRQMEISRRISLEEIAEMLTECLEHLSAYQWKPAESN